MTPTFIVGLPRSGTTLLSTMLNAHSLVSVPPETHYFTEPFWGWHRRCATRSGVSCQRFLSLVLDSATFRAFAFTEDERQEIETRSCAIPINHHTILDAILSVYANRHGKQLWVEKTPGHIEVHHQIRKAIPDARFIHLVRDPRDVSLSLRKVNWNRATAAGHYRRWKHAMKILDRDSRCLQLRYEDLLREPREVMSRTLRYLELDWDEAVLNPDMTARRSNFDLAVEPWKAKNLQRLDPNNTNKWRKEMPEWEKWWAERCLGEALSEQGYSRACVEFRVMHAANAVAREMLWPLVYARFLFNRLNGG